MAYDFDSMTRKELLDFCKRGYKKCFKIPDGFSFTIGLYYKIMFGEADGTFYAWIVDDCGDAFYQDEQNQIEDYFRSEPEPSAERFAVIIAGTRSFKNYHLLEQKCDAIFQNKKPTAIICGGAEGADTLGKQYARNHNIPVQMYPADWKKHGKSAGYIRNKEMLEHADALVAFWNSTSKGTKNMIEISMDKGIPCRIVRYKKEEGNETD